ncbi:hypothetical protein [Streptomyces lasalocidi]|uniref:Uncharacterized protein n=1 Tax=Streptomyces lasalocidi TaxID=324833 RepID=A0A4U5W4M9_STRLS|nr:hypothetical protein [Streptomyces lasalocidi]TKS96149.1 hypothetical protein E4U91_35935 [Streptomyces lasalocidi]
MPSISHAGAVHVEYNHFPVGELWEPGFERKDDRPNFQTDEAVIVVPGRIIVRSRLQEDFASVALALSDRRDQAPGPEWALIASVTYRPVYKGRMAAFDTTNGPAGSADKVLEAFGCLVPPGEAAISLEPSHVYDVQVWARGGWYAPERFNAVGPEAEASDPTAYVVVFSPSGTQEAPAPAAHESRRERLARTRGKLPLNMR